VRAPVSGGPGSTRRGRSCRISLVCGRAAAMFDHEARCHGFVEGPVAHRRRESGYSCRTG
jgi:hypothetical protein